MASECVICIEKLPATDTVSQVTPKGFQTLITSSLARNNGLVVKFENVALPQSLHTSCRKQYTRPTSIKSYRNQSDLPSTSTAESMTLRSCEIPFYFRKDCLFCGEEASMTVKLGSKRRKSVTNVETIEFWENILIRATERNDEFGQTVSTRVQSCIDLISVEPIYHRECRRRLFLHDVHEVCGKRSRGRPDDESKAAAFLKLCSYLDDNDECQYSLGELLELMDTYLDGQEGYTTTHLQSKLSEHYGG